MKELVSELGQIIGNDVDFIGPDGYIAASTIDEHIGKYHAVGNNIIDKELGELYVSDEMAEKYVLSGLYLSIKGNSGLAGVIGLIGNIEHVGKYGNIVRRMVEILIRELDEESSRQEQLRMKELFLEEWLLQENNEMNELQIERGLALGVDVSKKYRIMVIGLTYSKGDIDASILQRNLDQLEKLRNTIFPDALAFRHVGRDIILVSKQSDKSMLEMAENFQRLARISYSLDVSIGIDGNHDNMHIAYIQADKAWRSTRLSRSRICLYKDLAIELFVVGIPEKIKEDYLRKVFPGCNYEEIESWMEIIEAYFMVDGSIQKGSEMLHMHKNTFQNKIKKMEEITGCDIRIPKYATLLYMAMVFFVEQRASFSLSAT